jgi:hypothetical protein
VDLEAAAVAGRTVRYWYRSWYLSALMVLVALKLAFGIWLTWDCGDALATGTAVSSARPFAIFGLAAGVLLIVLGLWLLSIVVRPALVIAAGTLQIQRGPTHTMRVPVGDVTGVGLVFERSAPGGGNSAPPGWHMMVWHGDERGEPVSIFYTPMLWSRGDPRAREKFLAITSAPPADNARQRFSLDNFDVAAETDPAKLADTYAARVVSDLYRYVLAQQGPTGLLAITEQQKHVRTGSRWAAKNILAFWSPDGVIGHADRDSSHRPA